MRGYLLLLEARALFLTHVCIVVPLKISHKDHPQIIHYATHSSNNSLCLILYSFQMLGHTDVNKSVKVSPLKYPSTIFCSLCQSSARIP